MTNEKTIRRGPEGIALELDSDAAELLTVSSLREVLHDILNALDERATRIITRRYGLDTGNPMTLHAIGMEEGVTRERIRQIEQAALKAFRREQESRERAMRARDALYGVLRMLGGSAREDVLDYVIELEEGRDRAALRLLLAALPDVRIVRETNMCRQHFCLLNEEEHTDMVHEHGVKLLTEVGRLLADMEFLRQLNERVECDISEPALRSALSVSRNIVRTPFEEWGLRGWPEATPRGVGDKAYIVLKRSGKPLHFSDIAKKANEAGFDQRKAHPQTVHNELIRDPRFVLVGRGLYALKDWGYKPGTVADVIQRILENEGKSMSRDELTDRVLKERMVRKNTVLLSLQNADRFEKLPNGTYQVRKE